MKMKKYLLWFANEHLDFRINEISSILKLFNIEAKIHDQNVNEPWWLIDLPGEEEAKKIASRSVLLRYMVELWAQSSTLNELHNTLKNYSPSFYEPYSSPETSFKIKVETFCNSQSQEEKVKKIESFNFLPLQGPVKLKKPDVTLHFIEFYGLNKYPAPETPEKLFFGRLIAEGQRDLINFLSLKKRKFIGNTSMDAQLSLIMANQALIKNGDFVLDPFVGTGSLLVAAAQFGAFVLGTDIDYLMVHGKSRPTRKQCAHSPRHGESILTNMQQYSLSKKYIDVVVADSSLPHWRPNLTLDAIITDPPYGIRESMERVGAIGDVSPISEHHLSSHIPSKIPYALKHLLSDLLDFASYHLVMGGRLVTWIPILRKEYNIMDLPSHHCLNLVGNSEQILSSASSRRLLTYQKILEPKEETLKTDTEPVEAQQEETFRKKYYKEVEGTRKERRFKALQNPQYLEKLMSNSQS